MPALVNTSEVPVEERRAPRFAIEAPARLRTGDGPWFEATTVNISRIGVLLRTAEAPPRPQAAVEIAMSLAVPGSQRVARVTCTGVVTRVVAGGTSGETLVAATIDEFCIEPAISGDDIVRADPLAEDRRTTTHNEELGDVGKRTHQGDET